MALLNARKIAIIALAAGFVIFWNASAQNRSDMAKATKNTSCAHDDTGLRLPAGFCASIFVDNIGHARHMVVSSTGVVYVNTWPGGDYGNEKPREDGVLVALQDKTGAGKADTVQRFGETMQSGGAGGTGIGIYKGYIYVEINDRIVRYALPAHALDPQGPPATIVSALPLGGDHTMHPFIINTDGSLLVDVGTATN